jgi:hypothetical protein
MQLGGFSQTALDLSKLCRKGKPLKIFAIFAALPNASGVE